MACNSTMGVKGLWTYLWLTFWLVIIVMLIFFALNFFHLPAGRFIDWVIGAVSAWWLMIVTTVPWNIYFEAMSVQAEAQQSAAIGIDIDPRQASYVKMVARRGLTAAIILHLVSAAVLFGLSEFGITPIGYVGCAAALLLTGLRPLIRLNEYVWERLRSIRQLFKYPREDVVELRSRTSKLEEQIERLEKQLNPAEPSSFAAQHALSMETCRSQIATMRKEQERLVSQNDKEHERLLQESREAISKISTDSLFLEHVREIIRFLKTS